MNEGLLKRIDILIQQSRYTEARDQLEQLLEQEPTNFDARFNLVFVLLETEDKERARELCDLLLEEEPDDPNIINLSTLVELADEKYIAAESKAELLIEMMPENSRGYELHARANLGKRNYDKALNSIDYALDLDPENMNALNLKTLIAGILGNDDTRDAIDQALQLDPENVTTMANHGYQLLREGKVNEALERLKEALSINPNNEMARYAMKEALRNKFFLYKLFFKYKEASQRLSAKGSWTLVIGAYIGFRIISWLAESMPFLLPLVYVILALFILTWVIDPLTNLYLLTNPYGRLLLSKDEKRMAKYVGASLSVTILAASIFFTSSSDLAGTIALFAFGMMIPLGTFLLPLKESRRKTLLYYTIGMLVCAFVAIVTSHTYVTILFFIGLFAYQWLFNGIMIKDNSRIFGD